MGDVTQIKMSIAMAVSLVALSVSWLTSGELFPTHLASDGAITEKDSGVKVEQYMGPILFVLVIAFASFVTLTGSVEIRLERIRTLFGRKVSSIADPSQVDVKLEGAPCKNSHNEIDWDLETIRGMKNELREGQVG
jgi:hypothetical protein